MAQNVLINGVTYQSVPEVDIPKSGGGTAKFYDTAGANITAADIPTGKTGYGASGPVNGSMPVNGDVSGTIGTKTGTVRCSEATRAGMAARTHTLAKRFYQAKLSLHQAPIRGQR